MGVARKTTMKSAQRNRVQNRRMLEPATRSMFLSAPSFSAPAKNPAEHFTKFQALETEHHRQAKTLQKLEQQLESLGQLQRRMCGLRQIRLGRLEAASDIFPVATVSGDFCSMSADDRWLTVALGDIAGKGLEAGIWFTHFAGLVREQSYLGCAPADSVSRIHRSMLRLRPEIPLTALFFARVDGHSGLVRYCNAGLPPSLVLRSDDSIQELATGGAMLGALEQAQYASAECVLRPGDTLLIYSDGILESQDHGSVEFGAARLLTAARNVRGGSAQEILYSILGQVQDFAGTSPRQDDFSLMVVRYLDALPRH
jgi:sigma-B regulation protein RsbU (phosphoserine phosphatase)